MIEEDKIKAIRETLKSGYLDPENCVKDKAYLAGCYSFWCGQLENILRIKPSVWNEIRVGVKSDRAAERLWEAENMGIDETCIRLRLKSYEKLIQGLNGLIRLYESEAKNSF